MKEILLTLGIILFAGFMFLVFNHKAEDISHPRIASEQLTLCQKLFKSGDKVNGMSDSCYDWYKAHGKLTSDGNYVK